MKFLVYTAVLGALPALVISSPTSHAYPPIDTRNDKHCGKKCVDPKKLPRRIKEAALLERSQQLEDFAYATTERNRLIGTKGHNDTIQYIYDTLTALDGYYDVELQPFATLVQESGSFAFSVGDTDYATAEMEFSPSGDVTAPLVAVSNLGCDAADYPAAVAGNIALISRGTCPFGNKSALAGEAGAAAAIIYNNIDGGAFNGTLGVPPNPIGDFVPTVSLSITDGTALRDQLASGAEVIGTVNVETVISNITTSNVIATTKCGNKDTILALGAHTDSVAAGPGINDDGSGTVANLEVAVQLAKYSVNNAVRFGFWAAEEEGLLGSLYYVDNLPSDSLAQIRAYLNFDMIASPNYVYALYDGDGSAFNLTGPAGSAEIEKLFEDYFAGVGLITTETAFDGRSDYQGFIDAGIPAGGIFTGAEENKTEEDVAEVGGVAGIAYDINYHQAGDNVSNLNLTAFVNNAKAIAYSVATYAVSFDSLPPKDSPTQRLLRRGPMAVYPPVTEDQKHRRRLQARSRKTKVLFV